MKKSVGLTLWLVATIIILLVGCIWFFYVEPKISLFWPDRVAKNFANMDRAFPSRTLSKSPSPYQYAEDPQVIASKYEFAGETRDIEEFLTRSQTTGFLVVHNDAIVHES